MPLPLQVEVSQALDKVLEKSGLREELCVSLDNYGATNDVMAARISTIIQNGKDAISLKAIETALAIKGIDIRKPEGAAAAPSIQFNIIAENAQLNQLFAPVRKDA